MTGKVGYSRAARCFRIIKFLCICQGVHQVLQFLNLNHKLIHGRRILFLVRRELITSQLSSSFSFCTANSLYFFNCKAISCTIFLKSCFSSLVRHIASSFPFESDQSIDLPDKVPSSGIGAACQFHKEPSQHFAFSILFCQIQTGPQIIVFELRSLLEKHGQLSFHGSHEHLFVWTEFFPFPFGKLAHSPILDFFQLSTTVSRSLQAAQRPAWISPRSKTDPRPAWVSPRSNVPENWKHRVGQHLFRAPEKTVVKSTVPFSVVP